MSIIRNNSERVLIEFPSLLGEFARDVSSRKNNKAIFFCVFDPLHTIDCPLCSFTAMPKVIIISLSDGKILLRIYVEDIFYVAKNLFRFDDMVTLGLPSTEDCG